jgi:hypothetical protein
MLQAVRPRVRFPMRSLDFFNRPNPSSPSMVLAPTQPLTEMSARNLPRGKGRPARKADKLKLFVSRLLEASTSHNPMGLHGLLQE